VPLSSPHTAPAARTIPDPPLPARTTSQLPPTAANCRQPPPQAEADDVDFPDEVDVPDDKPARERFARYRGLKSLRSSPWDPREGTPADYERVFAFENFKRTHKRAKEAAVGGISGVSCRDGTGALKAARGTGGCVVRCVSRSEKRAGRLCSRAPGAPHPNRHPKRVPAPPSPSPTSAARRRAPPPAPTPAPSRQAAT
jgi:hypothetical protein